MEILEKAKSLVSQMTLAEKASLCSGKNFWYLKGVERLGLPEIMVTDGPHGLRKQAGKADFVGLNDSVPATCFPTASALAATWNRELVFQVGQALGQECLQEKVGVILGPAANIKRSPLCGRNFEYFSEDPYLTGEIAKSHIQGVQSQGVGTSLKHFAVNNQEFRRMTINEIVDERALREIYLPGYETAVKDAQPWTVMCAYNKINGTYCCENKEILTDILKDEWSHAGLVVTDWGAMNERIEALKAGLELEMPGGPNGNDAKIVAAVECGQMNVSVLDRAAERVVALILKAQQALSREFTCDMQAHHELARRVSAEGAVLLKNDGSILPLQKTTRFAMVGRFAKKPRYQGAGSSLMNPTRLDNLYDEILKLVGGESLAYAPGYTEKGDQPDETLIQEALALAQEADVVVICAGLTDLYETEGVDRAHLHMPAGHDALIQRIAAAHSKVVVVLSNGSPVEMPWAGNVPCILEGYLGGQAGAGGIADVLFGRVNPSGKLAETFPLKLEDTPAFHYYPGGPAVVEYRESLYVGYRYYDTVGQAVLFPFGHGLSYTSFEYAGLALSQPGGPTSEALTVTFKVRNTGKTAGKEIVQLYVRDVESSAFRPEKELKGFAKVELQPGQETTVTLELDRRAFAWYDPQLKDWRVESGSFEILVGASSRDIRLKGTVEICSAQPAALVVDQPRVTAYFNFPKGVPVSREDFEALLGRPVSPNLPPQKGRYDLNTPIGDMSGSFIGRQFAGMMKKNLDKMILGQEDTPMALLMETMLKEMPLRSLMMMGGSLNREKLEALLTLMNGHLFKGVSAFIKANRSN
jgi:beta-glucosidase